MKSEPPLTPQNKVTIALRVLVEFEKVSDVAKEFRVSQSYISRIVNKIKKNKAAFDELYEKME